MITATMPVRATGRKLGDVRAVADKLDCSPAMSTGWPRVETLVWLVLYRDTNDGTARTAQSDIARRAGVNVRTVKRAIAGLHRRGLLVLVHRGSLRQGPSTYRLRSLSLKVRSTT